MTPQDYQSLLGDNAGMPHQAWPSALREGLGLRCGFPKNGGASLHQL